MPSNPVLNRALLCCVTLQAPGASTCDCGPGRVWNFHLPSPQVRVYTDEDKDVMGKRSNLSTRKRINQIYPAKLISREVPKIFGLKK